MLDQTRLEGLEAQQVGIGSDAPCHPQQSEGIGLDCTSKLPPSEGIGLDPTPRSEGIGLDCLSKLPHPGWPAVCGRCLVAARGLLWLEVASTAWRPGRECGVVLEPSMPMVLARVAEACLEHEHSNSPAPSALSKPRSRTICSSGPLWLHCSRASPTPCMSRRWEAKTAVPLSCEIGGPTDRRR